MEKTKKLTILEGGIIFTVVEILFLIFSFKINIENFWVSGAIGEIVIIMFPAILLTIIFRKSIVDVFKIKKVNISNLIIVVVVMCFSIILALAINYLSMLIIYSTFGTVVENTLTISNTIKGLVLDILIIGVCAGVCEELLFRGAVFSSFEKLGLKRAIVFTAILFAGLHFSIEGFLSAFTLGLIITYIVYRTGSLFAGILAHFTNNTIVAIILYNANKVNVGEGPSSIMDIVNLEPTILLMLIIVMLFLIVTAGAIIIGLLYILRSRTEKTKLILKRNKISVKKYWTYIPGILLMLGVYIYMLIVNYL